MTEKCRFRKKNGARCSANAQPANGLCVFHDPARAADGRRARKAGGIHRSRAAAGLLEVNPGLEGKTIFEYLQRRYTGRFAEGQLRTLQRRVKVWRATEGPVREVFFAQRHQPGRLSASDFTHMSELGITIQGQSFPHLLYHLVLTYSNWESARYYPRFAFRRQLIGHDRERPPRVTVIRNKVVRYWSKNWSKCQYRDHAATQDVDKTLVNIDDFVGVPLNRIFEHLDATIAEATPLYELCASLLQVDSAVT
jgi:hypothetical protein